MGTQPDYIPVGATVRLVSVEAFAREIGVSVHSARVMLKRLGVPLILFAKHTKSYFNLAVLEVVLFAILTPGGRGWVGERSPAVIASSLRKTIPQSSWNESLGTIARLWGIADREQMRRRCREFGAAIRDAHERLTGKKRLV